MDFNESHAKQSNLLPTDVAVTLNEQQGDLNSVKSCPRARCTKPRGSGLKIQTAYAGMRKKTPKTNSQTPPKPNSILRPQHIYKNQESFSSNT